MKIEILSKNQIEKIHLASLQILEEVGVVIPHDKVLSLFKNHGATVDLKSNLVKIPPRVVQELLQKAGKKFTIYGRDLSKKAKFGHGTRNYNTSAGQAIWIDDLGGKRRQPTLKDVEVATKYADALEQITIAGAMADPLEIPLKWRCVSIALEMIKNTKKPIAFWFHDKTSASYINELVVALRGSKKNAQKYPLCYPLFEPVSPLSFPFNGIDLLFETSELNMPVQIGPMAQMGVSSPATIVGTLTQENAEILAAVCITQLIKEGIPVCYGGICHAFDMKTAQIIFGGPEQAIFSVSMTQMGKFYGFPVYINAGLTDSKALDAQAGLECGMTLALGASSGADIFGHMGICGMDQGASLDILTMQTEIISYVENLSQELTFDDEAFGIDILKEVGPKGNFLNKRHTLTNIKKELWFPSLLDRRGYDKWIKNGAFDMKKRCKLLREDIMVHYEPEAIDNDLKNDLEEVVVKAKKDLST